MFVDRAILLLNEIRKKNGNDPSLLSVVHHKIVWLNYNQVQASKVPQWPNPLSTKSYSAHDIMPISTWNCSLKHTFTSTL